MTATFDELIGEAEGEKFERKSCLDPSIVKDMLGLVADIVAMTNTGGGRVVIGTLGVPLLESHIKLFDSAKLDDKVNAFAEPNVSGITSSTFNSEFILIEVEKSKNPPHVFKKEGNYDDPDKGQRHIFRARDILVRHSSKTERATRSDLDRMFSERQHTLFEKVKMVFEAPAEARVQIVEGAGAPVRIDPTAPDARPLYDHLTSTPFRDLDQELIGGVKSWKTSHQLLNDTQIMKAYRHREKIHDQEVVELLLRSCWERHIPGFFWAARLDARALIGVLEAGITAAVYPASVEALKIASLLPRDHAATLFRLAEGCSKRSVRKMASKLEPVLRARSRKYEKLIEIFYRWQKLTYVVPGGVKIVEFDQMDEAILNEIIETILAGTRENRATFKTAEALLYATDVGKLLFPDGSNVGDVGDPAPGG